MYCLMQYTQAQMMYECTGRGEHAVRCLQHYRRWLPLLSAVAP